jgi:hypothetical protein
VRTGGVWNWLRIVMKGGICGFRFAEGIRLIYCQRRKYELDDGATIEIEYAAPNLQSRK